MPSAPSLANSTTQCHSQVRAFKTRVFERFAREAELSDADLLRALKEMDAGLVDAQLAPQLFKKRVAVAGKGKRGGARMIVAAKRGERYVFLYGFKKNQRDNVSAPELRGFKALAERMLSMNDFETQATLNIGDLKEIK